MNPRNKNLFIVLITAIISAALLLVSFFAVSTVLSSKKLSAINLNYDSFLRYSTLAVVIATIIASGCVFGKKLYTVIISTVIIGFLALFTLYLFVSSFTSKSKIIDGFGYVFSEDEYLRFGLAIQQKYNCCGWENATYIIDEMSCTGPLVCKSVVTDIIGTCSIIMEVFSLLVLVTISISLFFSYKLIKEVLHPVPLFDELTLQNLK